MAKVAPTASAPSKPTAPAGGARPGTVVPAAQGDGKKKEKIVRTFHPLLKPEEKKNEKTGKTRLEPTARLKDIPADYDPKKHKPLQRRHFEDESLWWELRARHYDSLAVKCRQEAVTAKTTGSAADRVKARRLAQMAKKLEELKSSLSGQGVDVEAIIKAAMASSEKKEEKTAA